MPSAAVLAPVVLPLVAAGVTGVFGLAGTTVGRLIPAAGAWGCVAALLAVWLPVRSSVELVLGQLGYGSAFDMRVDAASFAFGLTVAAPTALMLTLQPRTWREATISLLAMTSAIAALESGGLVLTAIAGGAAATLAVVLLETEDPRAPRPSWALLLAGWRALAWVGVLLQVRGGTAVYSAVPVATVNAAIFGLLGLSALLVSCLFPWRTWPAELWSRPSLRAAGITVATLFPLGFYLLVRAYELGDGRYPNQLFNAGLATLGVVTAFAAAARAQAASTRREFLGEVIPFFGGLAMTAITIGSALGLVAGIVMLATAAALTAALAVLPDRATFASLVAIAAAVGLPPGLAFASRVIAIEASFEAGDFLGLIGIAAMAAWLVLMVAGARAIGLPGGRGHPEKETFQGVSLAIAVGILVAGPAAAAIQLGYADPVAAEVMPGSASSLGGGLTAIVSASSVFPVVTLLIPLLLLAILLYALVGSSVIQTESRPVLFRLPPAWSLARARTALRSLTVPEQYRSILGFRELEQAAASGRPALWLAALAALAFAVTR